MKRRSFVKGAGGAFGLHKVAEYTYGPGVHEPGPANTLTVDREAYDALLSELRNRRRRAVSNDRRKRGKRVQASFDEVLDSRPI
jgi:TRAP-type mannitol/chloroaromatic compound transport system substrate-binding protein